MLESSELIAFAATTDLRRAREFYEQVLGLAVTEDSGIACVFDAHGTMLRVTAVPQVARPGYTVLGWRVTDIRATVRGLAARGVAVTRYDGMDQDEDGVWTAPGGDQGLVHRSGRQHPVADRVRFRLSRGRYRARAMTRNSPSPAPAGSRCQPP